MIALTLRLALFGKKRTHIQFNKLHLPLKTEIYIDKKL